MGLRSSVGKAAAATNKNDDVMLVQKLLNSVLMGTASGEEVRAKPAAVKSGLVTLDSIPPFASLQPDGKLGAKTVAAIVWFQKNVLGFLKPDGVVTPSGRTIQSLEAPPRGLNVSAIVDKAVGLPKSGSGARLTESNYEHTAKDLGLEVAVVRAVAKVESTGTGFIADGRPVVRFEARWFSRLTDHFYDGVFPAISASKRNDSLVQGGEAGLKREFSRLLNAMALDRDAALRSTSWGLFQIMGFNHQSANFNSVDAMVDAMFKTEERQLQAFASFVRKQGYVQYLKKKDWVNFAYRYNGDDYGNYDDLLESAYQTFSQNKQPGVKTSK